MKTKSTRKNVLISRAYSKNVKTLIKRMEKDYINELSKVNKMTLDASIESQKRITLNKLSDKWFKIFSTVAFKIAMRFLNPLFKIYIFQYPRHGSVESSHRAFLSSRSAFLRYQR